MTKFILIAFGFLGFAFYELSGGSDFDPEALRASRVDASPVKNGLPKVVIAQSIAPKEVANFEVTRAAFNLVDNGKVDEIIVTTQEPTQITQAALIAEQNEDAINAIILPSLIAQPDATTPVSTQSLNTLDVRFVASNLANVRGGPGTNFDIVGKLTRGAEVEILLDNGDGWVEMRSLDGATIGWMADFLLDNG